MKKELKYIKTAFAAEWLKTKNLGLLILALFFALVLPILSILVQIFNESSRKYDGVLTSVTKDSLIDGVGSFGTFFMLLLIIIAATRIAQTDHKNNGWTFLETQPLSKFSIYSGKFLVLVALTTISLVTFFVATMISGFLAQVLFPQENLTYAVDLYWVSQTFVRMFVLSLGIISLQMMLSIIIPGFIWPFVIGFVGFVINIVGKIRQETYDYSPYNNIDTALFYKDSYKLNHFFNYTEYLSLFWAIVFFVIGYIWYSRRGFKNAFLRNGGTIAKTLVGIIVFAGIYFFITKPDYPQKDHAVTSIQGSIYSPNEVKTVKIVSEELKEPLADIPVKDGKFSWESKNNLDLATYILIVDKKQYPFVLSKGDKINFDIKSDPKHFEVTLKGTRKAEDQYVIAKSGRFSMFYSFIVADKQLTNDPEEFYKAANEEWEEGKKYLGNYRTKENIYFADDFRQFQQQKNAVALLNAIYDYQKMTSFTNKKFAPPQDLMKELQDIVKKPTSMLLSNVDYKNWKLKEFLPKDGTKNPDSIVFVKLSQMPKSLEKDQLLSFQMLKVMNLIKEENQRNELFRKKFSEFQNSKYQMFVGSQLKVINNQQKGKPFPAIAFEDESGKKMSLAKFKGKYVVIDLWATWCAPCRETTPVFEYQANKYSYNDKLVFLSASIDADKNKWKLDLKNKKSAVIQWWVSDPNVLNNLGVEGIPRFIMIDPEGKIYNANLPRPDETNFINIIDEISENDNFTVSF